MRKNIDKVSTYDEQTSVLIVGGGVVGLSLALFLQHQQVSFILVERHAGTSILPRARGLHYRTLELYHEIGLDQQIYAAGASVIKQGRFGGLRIGRTLIDSEEQPIAVRPNHPGGLLGQDASPSFFCFCPQDELEPILIKAAYERGGDLRFSTAMTSFEQDEDGVTAIIIERTSGGSRTIRAQYMVAADGARSPIRTVLGITTSGQGTIEHYLNIYFHADLSELVRDRTFSQCSIENTDVRGLFISINNTDRWAFHLKYDSTRGERAGDFPAERCLALLRKAIGVADITIEIKNIGPWEAAVQIADRYQSGRVHLIGDAAHLMPPWGGHGANTGIADAHNLAWKLAAVLKGQAAPALLATCIEERRPVAKMAAEQAALGTDIYTRYGIVTNDNVELLKQRINPFLLILGYHYHSQSILEEAGNIVFGEDTLSGQPGTRVPHIWFEHKDQKFSTLDLLGKHFVLFTTAGEEGNVWCEAAQAAAKQLSLRLDMYRIGPDGDLSDPDGRWLAAIHGQSDNILLVRPDGFVAWRGHRGEVVSAAAFERIFKHILGFELTEA
ncbi:FAD-dependent monooxygenase [Ktedonospora formicarum]|uniref:FAD-binding monooxygenase n=1 Tax=Ktedonospora formicarum TaxID=2778364 RepID=A0A8J3MVX7_9CHLR|nr:FAD-dependent monooxygenase [Ktedonospora formicarum]GHO49780.1 FAD-binding monooxygenase [Ktedonospora formicarum]